MLSRLDSRNLQDELMDSPGLDPDRFVGSLRGLRRVNLATRSARILWPALLQAAREKADGPLRVLDVACGGGDVLITLRRRLNAAGHDVAMHGCDANPLAIGHAFEEASRADVPAHFFQQDAVGDPLPEGYDVIMCSLFLHHLSEADAVRFLSKAAVAARRMVLVHDLVRSRAGYLLAYAGVRLLLCNDVCHTDGPKSVEGAFTVAEARGIAQTAGLEGCTVNHKFPGRFLMTWRKP